MIGRKKVGLTANSTSSMPTNKQPGMNKKLTRKEKKNEVVRIRSVQNAFKYNQMLKNGVCVMDDDLYSMSILFSDTNFSMAPEETKINIFTRYMEILNSLSTDKAGISLTINNRLVNEEQFRKKMIIPLASDGLDDLRMELNQQRLDDLSKGHNKIVAEKIMTVTVNADNVVEAKRDLDKAAYDLEGSFQSLG